MRRRGSALDRYGAPGYLDLGGFRIDVDEQLAGTSHVLALQDRHARWRFDRAELTKIGAKGCGCCTCSGILDNAADRERVARVECISILPPDEVQGREVTLEHV